MRSTTAPFFYSDLRTPIIPKIPSDPQPKNDPDLMSGLAWIKLVGGYALDLGEAGWLEVRKLRCLDRFHVLWNFNQSQEQLTTCPVCLSCAFAIAEKRVLKVTGGNLDCVVRDAPWRRQPAFDEQLRQLEVLGVPYLLTIQCGDASDLIFWATQLRTEWRPPCKLIQVSR